MVLDAYDDMIAELGDNIPQWMNELKINGFATAIVDEEGMVWSHGFGYTDLTESTAVTSKTLFMIGSLSKAYTATGFLRAVQKGIVGLDDRLVDYYPDFNWKTRWGQDERKKITFRHLLTHWAGLQHNANIQHEKGGYCSFQEYIQRVNGMWQKYPVGTRFSYSNIGYDLVAHTLEQITGKTFENWMRTEVYKPLGMKNSTTKAAEALLLEDSAKGCFGDSQFSYEDMLTPHIASGSQFSSVDEMSRFLMMHFNEGKVESKTFLETNLLEEMYRIPYMDRFQLRAIGMGIGVLKSKYGGELFLSFYGDGPGYLALHQLYPKLGIGWVMTTNQSMNSFQLLKNAGQLIEKAMITRKISSPPPDLNIADQVPSRPEANVSPEHMKRLTGSYVSRMTNIDLNLEEGKLVFDWQGSKVNLIPHSSTEYTSPVTPYVKFNLDLAGRPLIVKIVPPDGYTTILDYNGGEMDPHGPDKTEWSKYQGIYMRSYGVLCWCYAVVSKEGYLYLNTGGSNNRLHERTPGLFFTAEGSSVYFSEGNMVLPDGVYMKEIPSAEKIKELMKTKPNDIRLHLSSLNSLALILELTNRNSEAEEIRKLIPSTNN